MKYPVISIWIMLAAITIIAILSLETAPVSAQLTYPLRVTGNGRFLEKTNGTPFFYLADTAWAMFKKLSKSDMDYYLQNRHDKKFTAIQTVALWDINEGFRNNGNINKPNTNYWSLVDYGINKAESLDLYVALLPTWGSVLSSGQININNAQAYGKFLGTRYRTKKIIWILGGDQNASGYEAIWRAMAKGIAIGVSGSENYSSVLMSFHPVGGATSATWFHNDPWLDFNMIQASHAIGSTPAYNITSDYNLSPIKPVVNGESQYENIPSGLQAGNPKLTDYDVRQSAYESVFAGGFGHTYGANEVYMFWNPGDNSWGAETWGADTPWHQALDFPGAQQMQYLRALMESRYFTTRISDSAWVVAGNGAGTSRIISTGDFGGRYAFMYIPDGHAFTINMAKMSGSSIQAWWYNPRNGASTNAGQFYNSSLQDFTPPSNATDWILVLDDVSQGFSAPGVGVAPIPPPYTPPAPQSPTANPTAYWNFNEASGTTATDVSGNANTGTLMGGPTWTIGRYSNGLNFDGVDDYLNVGDQSSLEGMNNLSVSLWVHFNSLPSDKSYSLLGKEGVYRFVVSDNGTVDFVLGTDNNSWYSSGTIASSEAGGVTTSGWYHLVGVYDGSRVKLYINGKLLSVSSLTISGALVTNTTAFTIANQMAANTAFSSVLIDDVRVYNSALSDSNIQWLYTH